MQHQVLVEGNPSSAGLDGEGFTLKIPTPFPDGVTSHIVWDETKLSKYHRRLVRLAVTSDDPDVPMRIAYTEDLVVPRLQILAKHEPHIANWLTRMIAVWSGLLVDEDDEVMGRWTEVALTKRRRVSALGYWLIRRSSSLVGMCPECAGDVFDETLYLENGKVFAGYTLCRDCGAGR